MKKGWKIALIVVGSLLSICGILFLVNAFTGNRVLRGYGDFNYQGRAWNNSDDRRSNMPRGMRGWNRSSSDNDFYLEHWAAMLGISEEELQARFDSGESLESIAESLGVEMPCWELNDDADLSTATTSYEGWGYGAGMCF